MDDVQTMRVFAETVTYSCTYDLQLQLLIYDYITVSGFAFKSSLCHECH